MGREKFTISINGSEYGAPKMVIEELTNLVESITGIMCDMRVVMPVDIAVNVASILKNKIVNDEIGNCANGKFALSNFDTPLSENDRIVLNDFIEFLENSDMAHLVERR